MQSNAVAIDQDRNTDYDALLNENKNMNRLNTTSTSILERYAGRLLMLIYALAYFIPIANRRLWIPDEARYAEISREMIARGDWIVPHLLGVDYFEKPVAGYWLNNISQLIFGDSNFAVRFASALCTGLTGWMVFWFAQSFFQSHKKAFMAAVIYLSFLLVYAVGTYSVLDSMVTLWLNLTLVAFYWSLNAQTTRDKWFGYGLVGFAAGLGFLTKGFISLAVPVIVVFPYLIYARKLAELRFVWVAVLSFAVVSVPWSLAIHYKAPDFWHYFFWVEHVQRFSSDDAQHREAAWYYLPVVLMGAMPWLGILFIAFKKNWALSSDRARTVFLLCWFFIPLAFFSVAKGKLPTYILICFAPLALLLAHTLFELIEKQEWTFIRINAWINTVFGALIAVSIALFGSGLAGKNPIYGADETLSLSLAVAIFAVWGISGLVSLRYLSSSLWLTALAPLGLGILLGPAMPTSAVYSKLPEAFIEENQTTLQQSRYVLANDPGLGLSLGWELKRDDIQLFGSSGELTYGISRSTQKDKLVERKDFVEWLAKARRDGDVALVAHISKGSADEELPVADEVITKKRFALYVYRAQRDGSE